MLFSPLEQFKLIVILPINFLGIDISITNMVLYLLVTVFILNYIINRNTEKCLIIPTSLQRLSEIMYMFMNNLVKQQGGHKGLDYFPILFLLFFFILIQNLLGLMPFGFTNTSQACNTFTLGFSMFIGVVLIGIKVQKLRFINQFIPDTTGPILPLLIVIEIFSYCIRPLSLSIRLFANMLAGHTLLHILSGFGLSLLKVDLLLGLLLFGPIIAICVLELGIAFLQSYVFVVLVCIYLKESYYGH